MTDIGREDSVSSVDKSGIVSQDDVQNAPAFSTGPDSRLDNGIQNEGFKEEVEKGSEQTLSNIIMAEDNDTDATAKSSMWPFKVGSLSSKSKHRKSTLKRKPDVEVPNETPTNLTADIAGRETDPALQNSPKGPKKLSRQVSVAPSRHQMSDTAGTGNIGGTYQMRKFVAQGLLDFALLTANASQLKNLLEFEKHPYFKFVLTMLSFSIAIQFAVPVILVVIRRLQILSENTMYFQPDCDETVAEKEQKRLLRRQQSVTLLDDIAVLSILVVTIINVLIATFISHGKVSLNSDGFNKTENVP